MKDAVYIIVIVGLSITCGLQWMRAEHYSRHMRELIAKQAETIERIRLLRVEQERISRAIRDQ